MRALQELGAEVRFSERKRGYDQTEVDEFATSVRRAAAEAQAHVTELRKRLAATEGQGEDGSHEIRETLLRTLVLAQRTADSAVAEARSEAVSITDSARERAAKTVAEAEAAADERLRSSEERAALILAEGEEQSQTIIAEGKRVAAAELAAERARAEQELAAMQAAKAQLEASLAELGARMDEQREALGNMSAALHALAEEFVPAAADSVEPTLLAVVAQAASGSGVAVPAADPETAGGREPDPAPEPVDQQQGSASEPVPEGLDRPEPASGDDDEHEPAAGFLPDSDDAVIGATGTENTAALEIVPLAGEGPPRAAAAAPESSGRAELFDMDAEDAEDVDAEEDDEFIDQLRDLAGGDAAPSDSDAALAAFFDQRADAEGSRRGGRISPRV